MKTHHDEWAQEGRIVWLFCGIEPLYHVIQALARRSKGYDNIKIYIVSVQWVPWDF